MSFKRFIKSKITITVMILLAFVFAAGKFRASKKDASKKSTAVRIEKPELGNLTEIVSAPGEIEPKTKVEISAKTSARITELPYKEGQQVTCGGDGKEASVLVRLDAKDMESNLRSAKAQRMSQEAQIEVEKARLDGQKANLKGLEATLAQAKRDVVRQKKLLDSNDISQATYDRSKCTGDELDAQYANAIHGLKAGELNLVVLEHNLEVADARIEQAMEALSYTVIKSPIDGIVTRINAEVGEMVMTGTMNNAGTVIIQVADLSQMLLVAQVDEADIGQLKVGQKATVRVQAFADEEFEGVVDTIALTHDRGGSGSKYFKTEILLTSNGKQMYSGLTADVDIETKVHENVLKLPSQAVVGREVDLLPMEVRQNSKELDLKKTFAAVVYKIVDGKAVVTPVTTGDSDMTHIVIESGITTDDQIVVGPYKVLESIKHGDAIRDEKDDKKDAADKTDKPATEITEEAKS